jgi:hypothetical protein
MVHLKRLVKLQWLCLKETKITDAGLEQLKGLTQLCDLYLSDGQATDAGLKGLHEALPNCQIHGGDHRAVFLNLPMSDPASYRAMVEFNRAMGEKALKVLTAQQRTKLDENAERIGW